MHEGQIRFGGSGRPAVVFDNATGHTNLKNGGDTPSAVDDTQTGVVNLGNQTGDWNSGAAGAIGPYSTISGGDDNQAGPTGYEAIGGGAGNAANGDCAVIGGGFSNTTVGDYSTIAGGNGNATNAEGSTIGGGEDNQAGGFCSVVSGGQNNQAKSDYAYAEGNGTLSNGIASHSEGAGTTASGPASHAEGITTQAVLDGSHAEGSNTEANAVYAHVEGNATYAQGPSSHAEGIGSATAMEGQHAHSSGPGTTYTNGGQALTFGATQHSALTLTGQTPGLATGESVDLDFGTVSGNRLRMGILNTYLGWTVVVTVIARGDVASVTKTRSFRQTFSLWNLGTTMTLEGSGVQESIGSAAAVSWTLTGSIENDGTDYFGIVFTTGVTQSLVAVTAKVEIVEISNFPTS